MDFYHDEIINNMYNGTAVLTKATILMQDNQITRTTTPQLLTGY